MSAAVPMTCASSGRFSQTTPPTAAGLLQLHTGSDTFVRPSIGSWLTYGLGTENQNLPGFITICPTLGHGGVQNWSRPSYRAYQGTPIGNASVPRRDATIRYIQPATGSGQHTN